MSSSPWTASLAIEKSRCATDVQRLLEEHSQLVVYEVMSELLQQEVYEQFVGVYITSQQSDD